MIKQMYILTTEDHQTLIDILHDIKKTAMAIERNEEGVSANDIAKKAEVGMFLLLDGFYN